MKVWIAERTWDYEGATHVGVALSMEKAMELCATHHEAHRAEQRADDLGYEDGDLRPWSEAAWAEGVREADIEDNSSQHYIVRPAPLTFDRDGDYGRLLAVTQIVGEADDQADLSDAVAKALTPA